MLLKEKAYLELRKAILNGELKPGDFLTEYMLVEKLEMSRTPIRAALERLDVEGLAKYTPNRGLVVTEISLNKAIDLYDYRIALESFVVRRLASRAWSDSDKDWFEENLKQQEYHVREKEYEPFSDLDAHFHKQLAKLFDNSEIDQAMNQIRDKLYQIALSVLRKDKNRIQVSYEDHVSIYRHIIAGEGDLAASTMEKHLEYGKRIFIT